MQHAFSHIAIVVASSNGFKACKSTGNETLPPVIKWGRSASKRAYSGLLMQLLSNPDKPFPSINVEFHRVEHLGLVFWYLLPEASTWHHH
ncbi:hypothetical protein AVEN_129306-1 [Araneus ventricosus]|uniref:Uncharacterized protein n=1 Tax=Araneus ventricosus TaxID=182803 RepID=A0A4Y2MM22_ARAVE|nr:hypothetical protein AVEN_129306-1 [Araneus ventricosus]